MPTANGPLPPIHRNPQGPALSPPPMVRALVRGAFRLRRAEVDLNHRGPALWMRAVPHGFTRVLLAARPPARRMTAPTLRPLPPGDRRRKSTGRTRVRRLVEVEPDRVELVEVGCPQLPAPFQEGGVGSLPDVVLPHAARLRPLLRSDQSIPRPRATCGGICRFAVAATVPCTSSVSASVSGDVSLIPYGTGPSRPRSLR